ncbi:MAG: hypothetical protein O3B72_10535 [Proteobacteria bacterium]|nr:hypothetical protein [Pseudomonadota bacterium]
MKHPLIRHTMLVFTLCLSGAVAADNCRLTKTIEKRFDADQFTEVELRALAGELEVTASADDQIHFWGQGLYRQPGKPRHDGPGYPDQ